MVSVKLLTIFSSYANVHNMSFLVLYNMLLLVLATEFINQREREKQKKNTLRTKKHTSQVFILKAIFQKTNYQTKICAHNAQFGSFRSIKR